MIDLKTLEIGDTVHFRCGGSAKVTKKDGCFICFNDTIDRYFYGGHDHGLLFDIIRIEKADFDWSTVKWGMGFVGMVGLKLNYIAKSRNKDCHILCEQGISSNYDRYHSYHFTNLTRAPAFDIKGDE